MSGPACEPFAELYVALSLLPEILELELFGYDIAEVFAGKWWIAVRRFPFPLRGDLSYLVELLLRRFRKVPSTFLSHFEVSFNCNDTIRPW